MTPRFMRETKPGVWVVRCRYTNCSAVGKRRGAVCATIRECHDWWREHAEKHHSAAMTGVQP